jgi:alkaline phosphatase D
MQIIAPIHKPCFKANRTAIIITLLAITLVLTGCLIDFEEALQEAFENAFFASFSKDCSRVWLGPEYWANPLQDWQVRENRIECVQSGGDRNVFLLTHELTEKEGTLGMTVVVGRLGQDSSDLQEGWVGFKLGVRGRFNDYRDSAVRGDGLPVGMCTDGRLFIGKLDPSAEKVPAPSRPTVLCLKAEPLDTTYSVTIEAYEPEDYLEEDKKIAQIHRDDIDPDWLTGGLALVCSHGKLPNMPEKRPGVEYGNWGFRKGTARGGNVRFWFSHWLVLGSKVRAYRERTFGPILFSQYTLSDGIMKMTAQMPPIGQNDSQNVELQVERDSKWNSLGTAKIDELSRTATFRIEKWNSDVDTPYRLVYRMKDSEGEEKEHYWSGTVRKEPADKEEFVVAGFTGNNDLGFPNNDFVKSVAYHDPDLLFFSGDQIYEGVGGYGIQTDTVERAAVDYLRKWYLYGWAYRDLMRDRPTISIPDDHDVYHGNLWGAGGKATPKGLSGQQAQDAGGYKMFPEWVNMVQRTQTSHLPDPYDPTPVEQDISVYYTNMNYGGISFAVIEDRKFKSAPGPLLPQAKINNGWPQNPDFDPKTQADIPDAVLLGDRQLKFLNNWADQWTKKTWMKVALSQTIFANVATLPEAEIHDRNVPKLRVLEQGQYPPDDRPVCDFDSNGWPQTGRNKALAAMRKAFAIHIAGDQHLGSTIQYGIDDWHDAPFAFCAPAVSNVWPRRWYPATGGANRKQGAPKYTGDFEDGFGNKMTVHAVSNPVFTGLKPANLYDRATGYGIVRFNRHTRDITIECWPRLSDPSKPNPKQYPGWPVIFNQLDNYNRKPYGYLPTLKVTGLENPVVQVVDQLSNEVIYTLRIKGNSFQPKVFEDGIYTVKIGPDTKKMKVLKDLKATQKEDKPESKFIPVDF